MMIKRYKISSHNSTVLGYPGRQFDWDKFDWEQKTEYDFGDSRYSTESEFIPAELRGQLMGVKKAPQVFVDDCLIAENCEYLHVPYAWAEDGTVYRVRPNPTMYTGEVYRGKRIIKQTATKEDGIWYWVLEFEEMPSE